MPDECEEQEADKTLEMRQPLALVDALLICGGFLFLDMSEKVKFDK